MNFSGESKLKEIASAIPGATKVLEDAGVDYCCGGAQSLHEACVHAGVSETDLLGRLREASGKVGPTDANWVSAPLRELTEHIRTRHHRYVREAVARVRGLLEKTQAKHGPNHPEIAAIQGLFLEMGREMTMHMQKEEQILFPYIEALERANSGNEPLEPPFFQTVRNPIHAMMRDHDSAGELTRQIRRASSEYTAPSDACPTYQALYSSLREFETDLHQHVHLENNILFPRAVEMEGAPA